MTRLLLCALLVVGCSASAGREAPDSREQAGQSPSLGAAGSMGTDEPDCEPVTCDAEVGSGSLAYFTAPSCHADARLVPIAPGDPVAYGTLCEVNSDGALLGVWVTTGKVPTPAAVWGDGCREMPGMLEGFEWWTVVQLDTCE